MKRLLLVAALAAASFVPSSQASADVCASTLVCGVSGCRGVVNVCGGGQDCTGTVSVCPFTRPADCTSTVDVCLGPLYVISCGPALAPVCGLLAS